ncbi:hypothetical protein BABINDRAFT_160439 [Babjeviella inositovora NRRL Y-12698]|uniref:Uncharacterized protein n=1 Tax=Babjeviella inositovora NRRL Y-12698 TaxID=984486 RepID=A0A1E3QTM5_9ASCO|nr:uncharacterized protein BABINDRAFT_160439 [Babjeviella inositovora NRRL Y-12698]ODQ81020.1 hypothetical protein BABINDRAFT_160439 [Babjeviella inositovora NRRL Y-12698]
MNLMNLLGPSDPVEPPAGHPSDGVYHFRTGLSPLQKQLIELVVLIHKQSLISRLSPRQFDPIRSIDTPEHALSSTDMLETLVRNVKLITAHPYLVVDHYMPKKLLLVQNHELLSAVSGKFQVFNTILHQAEHRNLKLVVVSQSVKELDLIEGFIIGRKLDYSRFSGTKLFNEERTGRYQAPTPTISPPSSENTDGKLKRLLKDDEYRYLKGERLKAKCVETSEIFLITSNQFRTNYFNMDTGTKRLDLIVSFDTSLPGDDEHINRLRAGDRLVPLIKLVPVNSINHVELLELGLENIAYTTLLNRQYTGDLDEATSRLYPELLDQILGSSSAMAQLPPLERHYTRKSRGELVESLNNQTSHKRAKITQEYVSAEEYKACMAQLVYAHFEALALEADAMSTQIHEWRAKESVRQLRVEELADAMAEYYRSLKFFEKNVAEVDKKVARVESEHDKVGERLRVLEAQMKVLGGPEAISNNQKLGLKASSSPDVSLNGSKNPLSILEGLNVPDVAMGSANDSEVTKDGSNTPKFSLDISKDPDEIMNATNDPELPTGDSASPKGSRDTSKDPELVKEGSITPERSQDASSNKDVITDASSGTQLPQNTLDAVPTSSGGFQEEIVRLRLQLQTLTDTNQKQATENDELRASYQTNSALAVDAANRLSIFIAQNQALRAKLDTQAKPLRLLTIAGNRNAHTSELARLQTKNAFLEKYVGKLSELVKEKNTLMPVGRSGRPSRSLTPYSAPGKSRSNSPAL